MIENNQNSMVKSKRGGARKGAGRKKGSATEKTREIADRLIAESKEGSTPLEVMLKAMAGFMQKAEEAENSDDPDERKLALKLVMMAADVAKDAAPYIHPRLSSIDHTTKGKEIAQTSGVLVAPGAMTEEQWEAQTKGND